MSLNRAILVGVRDELEAACGRFADVSINDSVLSTGKTQILIETWDARMFSIINSKDEPVLLASPLHGNHKLYDLQEPDSVQRLVQHVVEWLNDGKPRGLR